MRFVPGPRPRSHAERPFDVFLAVDRGAPLDQVADRVLSDALAAAREAGLVIAAAEVAFELGRRFERRHG